MGISLAKTAAISLGRRRRGDQYVAQPFRILAEVRRITDGNRVTLPVFYVFNNVVTTDGRIDGALHVANREAVTGASARFTSMFR